MDKNKIIILALIVIIVALLVGMAAMVLPNMNKQDTKLTFKTNSTITEGDSLKIKLTDANDTAIANQTVNITITDKDGSNSYYSVVTNQNGTGKLEIHKSPGKYNVTITYGGNDKYKGCNATKEITIEEHIIEQSTAPSSSSGDELYYDEEINVYYNSDGIVVDPDGQHPQGAGESYSSLREARERWENGEPVMV